MSEKILEKYCQFILNKYEHIRSLDEHVPLTMKDYMPLQLGEERERPVDERRGKREDRKGSYEDFRVWREEHTTHKEYSITPVEVWKAIKNQKIVIKGDPGSGKTTLTQYIAYTLCTQKVKGKKSPSQVSTSRIIPTDLLPLVIDLKDWTGKSLSLSEYYIRHVIKDSGLEKEIETLIDEWLTSGRCIILFDGLDEVVEERDTLIKSLQNLTSGTYGNCHFVVTTRIVGYSNELSGWQHYEVMSLKDEHIKNYVQSYLKDTSTDFLTALNNTPQMSPFSRNPLLLNVLCFVFKKQVLRLPTQRIELYHQAVHEMLKLRNPEIPESVKENVLKEIAIYFLEGKEIFEEEYLRKILRDFLKKEGERHNEDDVLKEIVEKSGLLCRFGDGRYIFLHLTFQEYLAACYIAEKKENPSQFFEPVLFNPRFREVIQHTAGMLGSAEKIIQFIKNILKQKPLCHNILHQPLLLAGLCIADIPEDKVNPALEELGKQIVDELWKLWEETRYDQLRENVARVFTASIGSKWANIILNNFLNVLSDEDSVLRMYAAEILGNVGRADTNVIQALLKALRDEELWVRQYAAESLVNLSHADTNVVQALLNTLRGDHPHGRWRAAKALGNLGSANQDVIQIFLNTLGDKDLSLRLEAATVLVNLGRANRDVIQALLNTLRDEDPRVRLHAAEALVNLGHADSDVIQTLLNTLSDEDSWGRKQASEVLGNLGRTDINVIQALLNALRNKDPLGGWGAAMALGNLGRADSDVIQALLNALSDEDSEVRLLAAVALGNLGRANQDVIQALLNTLRDENPRVRLRAALALVNLGCADPDVIQLLLKTLRDENNSIFRQDAAEALGNLGCGNTNVIQTLLNVLSDEDSSVRECAVEALGNLGRADNNVIQPLRKALRKKSLEREERNLIYEALHRLVDVMLREGHVTLSSDKDKIVLPVEVTESKDTNDQEAQRLLKFISGFKEPPGEQSGDTQNDPQIMRIIGFIEGKLQDAQVPLKILDYGCGKGTLINELKNIGRFMNGEHEYIGVNHNSTKGAEEQARKCGFYNRNVKPRFFTTEAFEWMKKPIKVDLIFKRNVTHEIPLNEIGRRFHYILSSLKVGGILYLLDMCVLPKAEFKSVTWEKEDFKQFFSIKDIKVESDTYESRSGIPLVVATITKRSEEIPSKKELLERAVELFKSKKLRTIKALELYEKSKNKKEPLWYLFLQNQLANIQRHLEEISKEVKT